AMQPNNVGFLLDDRGRRLAIDALPEAYQLDLGESRVIDHALRQRGFVLIQPAHRTIFVELCPSKVAPLAALEAFYELKGAAAECIVLTCSGRSRKSARGEPFSVEPALKKIEGIARAASRRAAADLRLRSYSSLSGAERISSPPTVSAPRSRPLST
ncbi:MAG: hypothetical protein WB678_14530, partial [Stellaceae bacterium]